MKILKTISFLICLFIFVSCSKDNSNSFDELISTASNYNSILYNYFCDDSFSLSTNFYTLHAGDTTKYYYDIYLPQCWMNNMIFTLGKSQTDSTFLYFRNPKTAECSITINTNYFKDSSNKANIDPFYFFVTRDSISNKEVIGVRFLDMFNIEAQQLAYPYSPIPETTYTVVNFSSSLKTNPKKMVLTIRDPHSTYLQLIIVNQNGSQ